MKQWMAYAAIRTVSALLRCLPQGMGLRIGHALGTLGFHLVTSRRCTTLTNLQHAFGSEYDQSALRQIAKQSFQELGKTLVELLCFPKWVRHGLEHHVTVQGQEHVEEAMSHGKGAVVFIGHLGNWELQALVYGQLMDHPSAIAFPLKNERLNRWVNQCRGLTGLEVIPKRRAARKVFCYLRANQAVGFIADQNAGREGIFVELFGRMASSSRGPATFAIKTGAPVLVSLDERLPNGHHILSISAPLWLDSTGHLETDVSHGTQRLMSALEAAIRQNPAQWMWMHDRWKSRPDATWMAQRAQRRGHETAVVE